MASFKSFVKRLPLLPSVYKLICSKYISHQLKTKDPERVFEALYKLNAWSGKDSVSGTGSDAIQTSVIAKALPSLFRDFGISTLLDIPCGDFHWMKGVDLSGIDYTGADIVNALIQQNTAQHERPSVRFRKLDLIKDTLPQVDLVFCRDCLVHLSFEDIFSALNNLCKSQSKYLLTTTFIRDADNRDINTGEWRVLNLERAPFRLRKPLLLINEECTESDNAYADKSLGLWRIADMRDDLTRRPA